MLHWLRNVLFTVANRAWLRALLSAGVVAAVVGCGTTGPPPPPPHSRAGTIELRVCNMSRTVADDDAIHVMTATEKLTVGAELRINANFDQQLTTPAGVPLEDYLGVPKDGTNFIGSDPDLLGARVVIVPATNVTAGQWRLTFPTDKIRVWRKVGNGWHQTLANVWTNISTFPLNQPLKIEGIGGSQDVRDVALAAEFTAAGTTSSDQALMTVVRSSFMLTFDDGPYRFDRKTSLILDALKTNYVCGRPVQAAFFNVGSTPTVPGVAAIEGIIGRNDISNHDLTASVYAHGHLVGNHTAHHAYTTSAGEILHCETTIRTVLNTLNPPGQLELIFRPPGLDDIPTGQLPNGYAVIWSKLANDFWPFHSWKASVNELANELDSWNTRTQPNQKLSPMVAILHEWPKSTHDHLSEIIGALRDKGFVLEDFATSKCAETTTLNRPSYYEE